MKNIIILISFLFALSSFAGPIQTGDVISAQKINNQTFTIGDIKHSLLTDAEFQSLMGDCWVKMDGSDVSSTDYGQMKRNTANNQSLVISLPDANGRFLRSIGGNAPALGQTQDDAIRNITGTFHAFGMTNNDVGRSAIVSGAFYQTTSNENGRSSPLGGSNSKGLGFNADLQVPTANENRPVNIGVNYFIKINHECN